MPNRAMCIPLPLQDRTPQEAQQAEQGAQSEEEVRAVLREAKQPLQGVRASPSY
jgi:hypothetical protein